MSNMALNEEGISVHDHSSLTSSSPDQKIEASVPWRCNQHPMLDMDSRWQRRACFILHKIFGSAHEQKSLDCFEQKWA